MNGGAVKQSKESIIMTSRRIRIFVSLILAVSLIMSVVLIASAQDTPFNDLGSSYAQGEIAELYGMKMYQNFFLDNTDKFRPEEPITRAEFLVLMLNAVGYTQATQYSQKDVPFADYAEIPTAYQPYVAEGYSRKLMMGSGNGGALYSDWKNTITREQIATIIGRALNLTSNAELPSTDADDVSDWALPYVSGMYEMNYMRGYGDGRFSPQDNITRADASHLIYKLMDEGMFSPKELRIYAGVSALGYRNGKRLESAFATPYGLALSPKGALIVADSSSHMIRQVTADGVTTVIGKLGTLSPVGMPAGGHLDDVQAVDAELNTPRYVVASENGDIFFTEKGNNVVRVYRQKDGKVYTYSGNGEAGYINGAREKTQFNLPSGIAFRNGVLYVADTLNNCIRTIDASGNTELFAGIPGETGGYADGTAKRAQFREPTDIQFGSDGSLYVLDTGNSMIRKIKNSQVTTVAGAVTELDADTKCMIGGFRDGDAGEALFSSPAGLFVTDTDDIYVADTNNHRIRLISNGFVSTVAGSGVAGHTTGPALVSMLSRPIDVVFQRGRIYVSDSLNNTIMVVKGEEN